MNFQVFAFAICVALILVSKRNYMILVPAFFVWIAIQRLGLSWMELILGFVGAAVLCVGLFVDGIPGVEWFRIPSIVFGATTVLLAVGKLLWASSRDPKRRTSVTRLLTVSFVAVMLAVPRYALDTAQNGTPSERADRIAAVREQHAAPEFRQSAVDQGGAYYGLALAARGVPLSEVLLEPRHWARISGSSMFGVYGYMSVLAPPLTYDVLILLGVALASIASLSLMRHRGALGVRLVVLAASVCMLVMLTSLLHSWVNDFQPQGRYLFPMLAMVALLLGSGAMRLGALPKLTVLAAFAISAASFWLVALKALAPTV